MIRALVILYTATFVFEGIIRWVLGSVGAGAVLYLRDFALVQAIYFWFVLQPGGDVRDKRPFLFILEILLLPAIVGLFFVGNLFQVLFGAKAFVPMLVGTLAYKDFAEDPRRYIGPIAVLFFLSALGVIGQTFVEYPWTGFRYDVGETEFGNRQWGMLGISRVAGFARVSFDAASQLLCLSLLLVCFMRRRVLALFVWIVAGVGITLTTTKGVAAAFIACTAILLSHPIAPIPARWYARILVPVACVTIFLPFLGDASFIDIRDPTYAMYLGSLWTRLAFTWPTILLLIREYGDSFLGRGLGGIGASGIFEGGIFAADNLGLHLYATFGLLGFIYLGLLVLRAQRLDISARRLDKFFLVILISALTFGITSSVIESATINIWIGMGIAHLVALRKDIGRAVQSRREKPITASGLRNVPSDTLESLSASSEGSFGRPSH